MKEITRIQYASEISKIKTIVEYVRDKHGRGEGVDYQIRIVIDDDLKIPDHVRKEYAPQGFLVLNMKSTYKSFRLECFDVSFNMDVGFGGVNYTITIPYANLANFSGIPFFMPVMEPEEKKAASIKPIRVLKHLSLVVDNTKK